MSLPQKIADFVVLPLLYNNSTKHVLYLREHVSKSRGTDTVPLPGGRTLFVVNIPPDATQRELTLFFESSGPVERIVFRDAWPQDAYGPLEDEDSSDEHEHENENENENEAGSVAGSSDSAHVATEPEADSDDATRPMKKQRRAGKKQKNKPPPPQIVPLPQPEQPVRMLHRSGSSAHVIFTEAASISRALALGTDPPDRRAWPPPAALSAPEPSGLQRYIAQYASLRPPLPAVRAHADSFLEVFDYNKALTKQKSQYKKGEAIVDEDGFTLVTRGGAYGTTLGGGVGVASKLFTKEMATNNESTSGKRGNKKHKKHEKDGFYRFQLHAQKRKELVDLKANFEKDKEKVAKMRESRRFKPY